MEPKLIRELGPYLRLYRDPNTGIAWVEDRKTGVAHSAHPNISSTGSVRAMKLKGFWKRDCQTVKCRDFIYNISYCRVNLADALDVMAMQECQCGGEHYDLGPIPTRTRISNATEIE